VSATPVRAADLAELDHPVVEPPPPDPTTDRRRWVALGVVLVVWVVVGTALRGVATQYLPKAELTGVQEKLNELSNAISDAKASGAFWVKPFTWTSDVLNWVVDTLIHLFVSDPSRPLQVAQIGWAGVFALLVLLAFWVSGTRIAVISVAFLLVFGFLGFWEESVETLIITSVSVALCALIGIPLGVWMARSSRARTSLTPVLDAMQTMPSFAYLAPLALLFGIGNAGAVVVTLIYALPPLVRLTTHGLRTVSPNTVEATQSLGATSRQLLRQVQLPMARRTIIVGLNQSIMSALSMAIIAVYIGSPGLGVPIARALTALNVGAAFVAGMCVVLMAILLDRATARAAERSEAAARSQADPRLRRLVLAALSVAAVVSVYLSHTKLNWSVFPKSTVGFDLSRGVNDVVDSVTSSIDGVTNWIYDVITTYLLVPLANYLADTPWWLVSGVILALALLLGGAGRAHGARLAGGVALAAGAVAMAGWWAGSEPDLPWLLYWAVVVVLLAVASALGVGGALHPTAMCLVTLFAIGLWNDSMVTLSMTIVATLIVMVFGVVLGVWMGRSRRADAFVRPILDFLQTMPSLVYLIPALALFPAGRFLAIAAAILYAAPVAIKIAADGIRAVTPTTVEAATSIGSSRWQMIRKVQLPMAKGSMVLATNQGLLFVLSMVVIGALVGGGSLGYLVTSGFSQERFAGKGLAAAVAITALGIMLDRITVHAAARYGRAETD
jgi:glycine betaine/proline transport system permease protein